MAKTKAQIMKEYRAWRMKGYRAQRMKEFRARKKPELGDEWLRRENMRVKLTFFLLQS